MVAGSYVLALTNDAAGDWNIGQRIWRAVCAAAGVCTAIPHKARKKFQQLSLNNKTFAVVLLIIVLLTIGALPIRSEIRTSVHWQYLLQILTGNWSSQQPQQQLTLPNQQERAGPQPQTPGPQRPDKLPQKEPYISDTEYVAGVIGALVINLGPYVLIFGAIWSLIQNGMKEKRMLLKEAIDAFEVAARAELIKRFADDPMGPTKAAEKVDEGLAEGRKAAIPIIRAVFGPEEAKVWENAQYQAITLK